MSSLIKTILGPTDFTMSAKAAEKTAVNFARKFQAKLILFHVLDDMSYHSPLFSKQLDPPDRLAHNLALEQLEEIISHANYRDIEVETKVVFGQIDTSIIQAASEYEADLIVMGAHGLEGLEQVLLGTNAKRVVQLATIPVLTVKNPLKISCIKNLTFASSFNQEYQLSFPSMYQYIEMFNAKLHMVKVITKDTFEPSSFTNRNIHDFADSLNLKDFQSHIVNANSIEEGLSWFCLQHHIDLLFMPIHGRTGLSKLLAGSHTEKMGQQYNVPVFSLKMLEIKRQTGVIFPD